MHNLCILLCTLLCILSCGGQPHCCVHCSLEPGLEGAWGRIEETFVGIAIYLLVDNLVLPRRTYKFITRSVLRCVLHTRDMFAQSVQAVETLLDLEEDEGGEGEEELGKEEETVEGKEEEEEEEEEKVRCESCSCFENQEQKQCSSAASMEEQMSTRAVEMGLGRGLSEALPPPPRPLLRIKTESSITADSSGIKPRHQHQRQHQRVLSLDLKEVALIRYDPTYAQSLLSLGYSESEKQRSTNPVPPIIVTAGRSRSQYSSKPKLSLPPLQPGADLNPPSQIKDGTEGAYASASVPVESQSTVTKASDTAASDSSSAVSAPWSRLLTRSFRSLRARLSTAAGPAGHGDKDALSKSGLTASPARTLPPGASARKEQDSWRGEQVAVSDAGVGEGSAKAAGKGEASVAAESVDEHNARVFRLCARHLRRADEQLACLSTNTAQQSVWLGMVEHEPELWYRSFPRASYERLLRVFQRVQRAGEAVSSGCSSFSVLLTHMLSKALARAAAPDQAKANAKARDLGYSGGPMRSRASSMEHTLPTPAPAPVSQQLGHYHFFIKHLFVISSKADSALTLAYDALHR